jgi:hypothetical protein
MAACLMQANPWTNVKQIKTAIEQSASQYISPDSLLGYGIPDFEKADKYLKINNVKLLKTESSFAVSPNPFYSELYIRNQNPDSGQPGLLTIYNLQGQSLWQSTFNTNESVFIKNLPELPDGFLLLKIKSGTREEVVKLVKAGRQ